jgi:hypothetical protein
VNYVTSYLAFQTRTADVLAEKMRIDNAGNVGIGTSSPSTYGKFAVVGTGNVFSNIVGDATGEGQLIYNNVTAGRISVVGSFPLIFQTNSNERMRITSAGLVGIGTSSPGSKLDVSSSTDNIVLSTSTGGYAAFQRSAPTGQTAYDFYSINGVEAGRIAVNGSNLMTFSTGAAVERMRLANDGTATFAGLLVGRVSSSTDVNIANDGGSFSARGNTSTVASMTFHRTDAFAINMGLGTDNVFRIGGWSASNNALQMDGSGNLTMLNNVTAYSDSRLKKDIVKIDNALDKVMRLNGYTYTRTDTNTRQMGVIAQEIMEIIPEVVLGSEDTNYSVAYGNMVALLIEAVKELTARVAKLEGK